MIDNEFYYLVMVIAAFGAFALAMVVATLRYKAWKTQQQAASATATAQSQATAQRKEMARAA